MNCPRLGYEVNAAQDAVVGTSWIREAYALEFNPAAQTIDFPAVGRPVVDLGHAVEEGLEQLGRIAGLTHIGSEREDGAS